MNFCVVFILSFGFLACFAFPTGSSDGTNELFQNLLDAIKNGNIDRVKELASDKTVNPATEQGRKPLHLAAEKGNKKIAEVLIQKGAGVNIVDEELLSPLHFAVLNGDEALTTLLIEHGADINNADIEGNTPLFLAALNSNEKVIETLLKKGANINQLNNAEESALYFAVLNSNEKVVELLIKSGIDLNFGNRSKNTALHNAIYNSNVKVVELLLRKGADINALNERQQSPLYWAVYNGNQKCKEELIKAIENEKHYTRRQFYETKLEHFTHPIEKNAGEKYIELFLKNGAEINHQDTEGKTAYDEADFYGNNRLKVFLAKHGGKSAKKDVKAHSFDTNIPSRFTVALQTTFLTKNQLPTAIAAVQSHTRG